MKSSSKFNRLILTTVIIFASLSAKAEILDLNLEQELSNNCQETLISNNNLGDVSTISKIYLSLCKKGAEDRGQKGNFALIERCLKSRCSK